MTSSAQQVAAKIRAGYAQGPIAGAEVQGSFAASKLEINHIPAQPGDGVWEGPVWAGALLGATKALQAAIPDFHQDIELTATGDEVRVVSTLKGTLKDGTVLNHTNRGVLTVKEGKIVKAVNNNQGAGDSRQVMMRAFSQNSAA